MGVQARTEDAGTSLRKKDKTNLPKSWRMATKILTSVALLFWLIAWFGSQEKEPPLPNQLTEVPTRTVVIERPVAVMTRPEGALLNVVVPQCVEGGTQWTQAVPIPVGWNVQSAWNTAIVRTQWRNAAGWAEYPGQTLAGSFNAVRYCTRLDGYAEEAMPLSWTRR